MAELSQALKYLTMASDIVPQATISLVDFTLNELQYEYAIVGDFPRELVDMTGADELAVPTGIPHSLLPLGCGRL